MREMGKDRNGAKRFCVTMNVRPPLRKKSYGSHKSKLRTTAMQDAEESMLRASKGVKSVRKVEQEGVVK